MNTIQHVTSQEFAFGAQSAERLYPASEEPAHSDAKEPWNILAQEILDNGIGTDHQFVPHDAATDVRAALRHLGALMQSSGDDGAIVAAMATLMAEWFAGARVGRVTAGAQLV